MALERPLPLAIRQDFSPVLLPRTSTVFEAGVEGVTFAFKWAPYGGHHYEDGFNAIEFKEVYDCFARDIATVRSAAACGHGRGQKEQGRTGAETCACCSQCHTAVPTTTALAAPLPLQTQINADSCVFIDKSTGVTVQGLKITQTKRRDPMKPKSLGDGHWGVHSGRRGWRGGRWGEPPRLGAPHQGDDQPPASKCPCCPAPPRPARPAGSAADVLVDGFTCDQNMLHVVGADAMSLFGVFSNGVMTNGNLELHRGSAGQALFTDISVGIGDHAFQSGGPASSGANTIAFTTFWWVRGGGGRGAVGCRSAEPSALPLCLLPGRPMRVPDPAPQPLQMVHVGGGVVRERSGLLPLSRAKPGLHWAARESA